MSYRHRLVCALVLVVLLISACGGAPAEPDEEQEAREVLRVIDAEAWNYFVFNEEWPDDLDLLVDWAEDDENPPYTKGNYRYAVDEDCDVYGDEYDGDVDTDFCVLAEADNDGDDVLLVLDEEENMDMVTGNFGD